MQLKKLLDNNSTRSTGIILIVDGPQDTRFIVDRVDIDCEDSDLRYIHFADGDDPVTAKLSEVQYHADKAHFVDPLVGARYSIAAYKQERIEA